MVNGACVCVLWHPRGGKHTHASLPFSAPPTLPYQIAPEFIFPFDALSLSPGRGVYVFMPYHSYYYPLRVTVLPYAVKCTYILEYVHT